FALGGWAANAYISSRLPEFGEGLPGLGHADAAMSSYTGHAQILAATTSDGLLHYGGGSVVTSPPRVNLVFWGPGWGTMQHDANGDLTFSGDQFGGAARLQEMYKGLGTDGELWSGVMTQYCQGVALNATSCPATAPHVAYPSGGTLAHAYYDSRPVLTNATIQQIVAEAAAAAVMFGNSPNAQFVIAFPTGIRPNGLLTPGGFCAEHGSAPSSVGTVIYTVLPY